jgi:hypothetical protein
MPRTVHTPHSSSSLQAIANRLEKAAASLRAVATEMEVEGVREMDVTRFDQLSRGMTYVESFAFDARQAFYKQLQDRGDFTANSKGKKRK